MDERDTRVRRNYQTALDAALTLPTPGEMAILGELFTGYLNRDAIKFNPDKVNPDKSLV